MTILHPSNPRGYTTEDLRAYWRYLNIWRKNANLRPYSFGFLAELARDANAIPGEPVDVSKATVYAVLRGTYAAATAEAIRQRLAACIIAKLEDMSVCHAESQPVREASPAAPAKPRSKRRTPRIHIRRCTVQGYITWRGNTYFLGSEFAGESCTIASLRDRSSGIRVTVPGATRDAYPIDAANNQLGYEVAR